MALEPYIPYKGNKFQIVESIYQSILSACPVPIKGVVDAFTGGGSVAYFFASHGYPVIANDIDKSVMELHMACRDNPLEVEAWAKIPYTKSGFKAWLEVECAQAALVRSLWSFSNDNKTYLTSTEKEQQKIEQFLCGTAEPNSRYKHIEDIMLLWSRTALNITFVAGSYEQLEIPAGWIVYCDIPYSNTSGCRVNGFDHEAFYTWALKQPGYVFISEYSMPDEFVLVDEYFKWVESGRGARNKSAVERIYCNKPVKKLSLF